MARARYRGYIQQAGQKRSRSLFDVRQIDLDQNARQLPIGNAKIF
jgi:hypothetical protein